MDLSKFYAWKRASVIVELAKGPATNEYMVRGRKYATCQGVYDALVEDGTATKSKGKYVFLGQADDIARARRDANRLLNELVKENEKLVRKLVGQFFKKTMHFTEEEDLYQAGLLAFCMALKKFDPAK